MLSWISEQQGYTVTPLDTVGASDDLLVERPVAFLDERPARATTPVCAAVEGTDKTLTKLLKERPEFDCCDGRNGAKLWTLAGRSAEGETQ